LRTDTGTVPAGRSATRPELSAAIWKVDRFATHDGPGIRTNVYFKGCPLRCLWCSNPEGQATEDQLGFLSNKCTGCGLCFDLCPKGAITVTAGRPVVDFAACDVCGECARVCSLRALFVYGGRYSVSDVVDIVERDRHIYRRSGGGVTLTGGEPLAQHEFARQLLAACHEVGIHTVVETCGCVGTAQFSQSLEHIDWLFFDLKHIDPERHRELTGRPNDTILMNLRAASAFLSATDRTLVIRQVVVPGLNAGDNIVALARLAAGLPRVDMIELLPYHDYGQHKYASVGMRVGLESARPSADELQEYGDIIRGYGIECSVGGL
jgi:pyruvate formate lyase activating enzyme